MDSFDAALPLHQKRCIGALLGTAVGDILGANVEFFSRDEILQEHGQITDFLDSPARPYGNVHRRHGDDDRLGCESCGRAHTFAAGVPNEPEGGRRLPPPSCHHCGGPVRPGVVWFGESLPEQELSRAFSSAQECDVLFVIGTSGLVQPAARLPALTRQAGAKVVQVNPLSTPLDPLSTWSLYGPAGVIMPRLLQSTFPAK
jgi:NAD-dependent deacetylase